MKTGHSQGLHSPANRFLPQSLVINNVTGLEDHLPDGFGERKSLVDCRPALESPDATDASHRPTHLCGRDIFFLHAELEQRFDLRLLDRRLAAVTQFSNQPLSHDNVDRIRDQEGLNAHLIETGNGTGCIIRVKRRQCQVTGIGELDGNFSGLPVTNFTYHNDVWIVTQDRPHRTVEIKLRIEFHLPGAFDEELDRVFHGNHIDRWIDNRTER